MDKISSPLSRKSLSALLLSGALAGAALAQTPKPATPSPAHAATISATAATVTPESSDKVVLKVGTRSFTKAEMDDLIANLTPQMQRAVASEGKKSLGDQYALVIALSHQAELQHLDQRPDFIHKLQFQKEQLEAQEAFEAISEEAKVTPDDVQQYYTAHSSEYDEITVRQIIVRKKAAEPKTDPAHPAPSTGPGLAPEEAKVKAAAIRKEFLAGTDAKKITDDFKAPGDIIIDAEPRSVRHGGMRPDMEKVAFALKDGEVSEPIDVPQALVMFQVVKHSHSELKEVTPEIEKKLRQDKVEASIDGVKKNANIWMDQDYFGVPARPELGPSMSVPPTRPQLKP